MPPDFVAGAETARLAVGPNVTEPRPGDYIVGTVRRPGSSMYDWIGTYDMTTDDLCLDSDERCYQGVLRSL